MRILILLTLSTFYRGIIKAFRYFFVKKKPVQETWATTAVSASYAITGSYVPIYSTTASYTLPGITPVQPMNAPSSGQVFYMDYMYGGKSLQDKSINVHILNE